MPESNRDEIAKLEALYATNPAGRVFTHLAEAYRKAGDYERARTILQQGIEKHPTYASAHVVLGRVLMDLNRSDEAVEEFRKVLQLDPHNLVALRSLGDLARAGGRYAEAMGYFEELRHQDPSNEEISGIISELLATPDMHAAVPAEPLPELPQAAQPLAEAEAEPVAEPPAPESQIEEMIAQAVEPQWGGEIETEETLPGDLADFARQAAPMTEPQPEPEPAQDAATEELEAAPAELPAELPIDLGPSDVEIQVAPEETFESIDLSEFSAAEEPVFEEVQSSETTLEPITPDPETSTQLAEAFEPAPELAEQTPVIFEPAADVFEPPPPPFAAPPPTAAEPAPPTGEVLTETMAELYRNQGLYDRAAEVYRALLLERPDDDHLKAKLQEVEAAMMPTAAASGIAPEAPPPFEIEHEPPFEAPPPFIATAPEAVHEPVGAVTSLDEEVQSPWTGFNQAASSEPSLYAWKEELQTDADTSPPVSEYFRSLLSWRPSTPVQSSFAESTAATDEVELFDLGQPVETAEEPLFEEPQVPLAASDRAATPPATDTANDEFDDWFANEPPPEAPQSRQPPAASMPPGIADQATDTDEEEDDDLEMFRSWLQSLKK